MTNTDMECTVIQTWILLLTFSSCLYVAQSACAKPTLPSNGYTLTTSKTSYSTDESYEIYCLPEYTVNGESNLTCLSSGSWSSDVPSCTPAEGSYPWYILLIGVVAVILLVPCIVPRIIYCCCLKKKEEEDQKPLHKKNNHNYDDHQYHRNADDNTVWRAGKDKVNTPITDQGKHQLTNMDVMQMYYGNT